VATPLAEVDEWLCGIPAVLEQSFQRLDALLDEMKTKEKKKR